MNAFLIFLLAYPVLFLAGLFVAILAATEVGRRLGFRRISKGMDVRPPGSDLIDGVVFALFGLLVAFTFSGAANRFEDRRQLAVEEANAVGTAYYRVDLLPPDAQPAVREAFSRYIQTRLEGAQRPTLQEYDANLARSEALQKEIWKLSADGARRKDASPAANMQLLPALNVMFDITNTRAMSIRMHTPAPVYIVIFITALVASAIAGYAMSANERRSWLHLLGFAGVTSLALFVLVDLEFPRFGLLRVEVYDHLLTKIV